MISGWAQVRSWRGEDVGPTSGTFEDTAAGTSLGAAGGGSVVHPATKSAKTAHSALTPAGPKAGHMGPLLASAGPYCEQHWSLWGDGFIREKSAIFHSAELNRATLPDETENEANRGSRSIDLDFPYSMFGSSSGRGASVSAQLTSGGRVDVVRMRIISSRIFVGVAAVALLLAAAEAHAQNVACGKVARDDAEIAAAWADLNESCTCEEAKATKLRKERSSFVNCARNFVKQAVKNGAIRSQCKSKLISAAKKSTCARKKESVPCCKTSKNGTQSCGIVSKASKCKPTKNRFAEIGLTDSCIDACEDLAGPECVTDLDCATDDPCTGAVCDAQNRCMTIVDPFCDPDADTGNDDSNDGGNDDGGSNDGGGGGTSCSGTGSSTHGLSAQEKELVRLINNYRKGGSSISACASLNKAAQDHANDMRDKRYYSHRGKNGSEFWERTCDAGYQSGCGPSTWMGEIITAWAHDAVGAFLMWKNSAGHDALMKDTGYKVAGIGHACGGPYGHYWVIDFAGTNEASCK